MSASGTHDCPKVGCGKQLPFETLACRAHWSELPMPLKFDLSRAWRRGDLVAYLDYHDQAVAILNTPR